MNKAISELTTVNGVDPRTIKLFNTGTMERFVGKLRMGTKPAHLDDECIEWDACVTSAGYGTIHTGNNGDKETISAHKWALMLAYGVNVLPPGMQVCHHCDNPICVNAKHLFLGTAKDNAIDKSLKGRAPTVFGSAKLNWDIVDDIRSSNLNNVELANKHSVSRTTISDVKNNNIWKEEHRNVAILRK